jgi:hypothetical protein
MRSNRHNLTRIFPPPLPPQHIHAHRSSASILDGHTGKEGMQALKPPPNHGRCPAAIPAAGHVLLSPASTATTRALIPTYARACMALTNKDLLTTHSQAPCLWHAIRAAATGLLAPHHHVYHTRHTQHAIGQLALCVLPAGGMRRLKKATKVSASLDPHNKPPLDC